MLWRTYEDGADKYSIRLNDRWELSRGTLDVSEAVIIGDRPFLHIAVKEFKSGESTAAFFERHRQELLEQVATFVVFEPGLTKGETDPDTLRNYIHMEYLWQPNEGDCLYHVVEHVFRSRFYPARDKGFVIAGGVCENQQVSFDEQRENILRSFRETE